MSENLAKSDDLRDLVKSITKNWQNTSIVETEDKIEEDPVINPEVSIIEPVSVTPPVDPVNATTVKKPRTKKNNTTTVTPAITPTIVKDAQLTIENAKPEQLPSYVHPFAGKDVVILDDYDKYMFKNVKFPSGKSTDKYEAFYIPSDASGEEQIINGLLSARYSAICLKEYVASITKDISVSSEKVFKTPFYSVWKGAVPSDIKVFQNDFDKAFFTIATGISDTEFDKIDTSLSLLFSNSYNGSRLLTLDYVLDIKINKKSGSSVNVTDYFSLLGLSKKMIHVKPATAEIIADMNIIANTLNERYELLKTITFDTKFVENVTSSLPKDIKKYIDSAVGNLPGDHYKTLHYLILIISIAISNSYSPALHTKIRNIIQEKVMSVMNTKK